MDRKASVVCVLLVLFAVGMLFFSPPRESQSSAVLFPFIDMNGNVNEFDNGIALTSAPEIVVTCRDTDDGVKCFTSAK